MEHLNGPQLPEHAREASRRLLASALACRIAIDLADVSAARTAAREVLALLDPPQRGQVHEDPQLTLPFAVPVTRNVTGARAGTAITQ
jgi:hypothetical protein